MTPSPRRSATRGINIKRTVLPGSTFWNDWLKYPFSATEWNMRPLGVQILALAYRSGEAWNESAFSNAEFDAELAKALSIADAKARSEVMKRLEEIMQEQGVMVQPYWRSIYAATSIRRSKVPTCTPPSNTTTTSGRSQRPDRLRKVRARGVHLRAPAPFACPGVAGPIHLHPRAFAP